MQQPVTERSLGVYAAQERPLLIIVGSRGSGKTILADAYASQLRASAIQCELGVDAVRAVLDIVNQDTTRKCFIFDDCDKMSASAKNALLHVTESGPDNSFFVLTCSDLNNLPAALSSRALVYVIPKYESEELACFGALWNLVKVNVLTYPIDRYCSTPGELKILADMGEAQLIQYNDYLNLILDELEYAPVANALNIGNKLRLKEDQLERWDIQLFVKAIRLIAMHRLKNTDDIREKSRMSIFLSQTSELLNSLSITGLNKQAAIDVWILNLQEQLREV